MSDFNGFPTETLDFLRGLAANNEKPWFDAHRSDYDDYWVAPAKAFVSALGPQMKAFAPRIQFEPRINRSIFRINRDVRFSKDKRPYKTQVDCWFWEGPDRGKTSAGYFFRLTPEALFVGAGIHGLIKAPLELYRKGVDEDGDALVEAMASIEAHGEYSLSGESTKRVPRGYDKAHPRAELLKRKALFYEWVQDPPDLVHTGEFPAWVAAHYERLSPIVNWLNLHLT